MLRVADVAEAARLRELAENLRQRHDELECQHRQDLERIRELELGLQGRLEERSVANHALRDEVARCGDMEEQLREREAGLRAVLDTVIDAILTIDERGTILALNPAAERMFGYRAEELRGRNVKLLMPSPYREEHDGYLASYLATGVRHIIGIGREVEGRRKDGSTFPLELGVSEHRRGVRRCFTGILRDLSAKKQLEAEFRQSQKMEAVGRLAGGIAHDFNNLLLGIRLACAALLRRTAPEDPGRELLTSIRDEIDRGADLSRKLLDFSRRRRIEPRPIALGAALERALGIFTPVLGEDIVVESACAAGELHVLADQGLLEQILFNLAVNARDAMPGGGKLTIAVEALEKREPATPPAVLAPASYAVIAVSDTGVGMDEATLARALEPFYTTKEVGKGTGLGLSTAYGILRELGGHLELESQPARGTTVRLYVPLCRGAAKAPPKPMGRPASSGRAVVLLVEDDRLVRAGLRTLLAAEGHEVLDAEQPAKALELIEQHGARVDLLLTDVRMPGMGGRELAEEVRRRAPHVRALFMSGLGREDLVKSGLLDPRSPSIQKPFDEDDLVAKVRAILE